MVKLLILLLVCSPLLLAAQSDSTRTNVTFSGYAEVYYAYDFGKPSAHNRPSFAYAFNRHNEVNLNFGYLGVSYETGSVRGNVSLMAGTLPNINQGGEPDLLQHVYQANVGLKLAKKKNLWVDAGILPSHIGFESAVGADCWTLSRSLLADNSPYYETGVQLSYTTDNEKWLLSALLLNGWQNIQRDSANQTPAFGHQVSFSPTEKLTLNSSSFVGNIYPDSVRRMRYFHNFYSKWQLSDSFGLIAGFDSGAEQKEKGSSDYLVWYAPILVAQYSRSEKSRFAGRVEYYSDKNSVIVTPDLPLGAGKGFECLGYSFNFDRQVSERALWRIEARGFRAKEAIFEQGGNASRSNFVLFSSLSLRF